MDTTLQATQEENTAHEETTTEKGTGTDQTSTAKTFTQEEVNKIVAKEKSSWKRSSEQAIADHETIVGGLRKDIERRDELITQQIDILTKDLGLDDETLELVNGLDVLERYQWIMKKVEKAGKQDVPRTPKGRDDGSKGSPFKRTQTV